MRGNFIPHGINSQSQPMARLKLSVPDVLVY